VHRLLQDFAAANDQLHLAADLGRDRALDEAEGVQILELRAGTQFGVTDATNRHVGVAAELTLLHVRVRDVEVAQDLAQAAQVRAGLLG
jgi:tRNA(Phe) wybutosine-synthesizing methylase Tyw3